MTSRKRTKHPRRGHQTPSLQDHRRVQPDAPKSGQISLPPGVQRTRLTQRDVLGILGLVLLVAVCYLPAARAGFVWDDFIVATSKAVQEWSGLWHLWFDPVRTYTPDNTEEGHYWPLLYTTFWLEHKLWGFAPAGYHLVNLLLHAVNTLLVWRLLLRLAVPGAWLAAAVFAVHPVHVEAVAWIIARKDVLSALFYLTAALTWLRFTTSPRPGTYVLALVLFAAGLLSKAIVISLPAALLIWHWWKQGRVTRTDLMRLLPFVAVGVAFVFADWWLVSNRRAVSYDYTFVERVLIAAHALWFYAGKLLWPNDLATIYPRWGGFTSPLSWVYVLAAVTVPLLLWRLRQRTGRGPLAGVLFFGVTLAPVLCLVDYSYMQFTFVADRYQYLASLGVTTLLIAGLTRAADKLPGAWRRALPVLAAVLLIVLGTLTWRQAGVYRDEVTFFRHLVAINPQERAIHLHLGKALFELERPEEDKAAIKTLAEAERHYRRALEIDPGYTQARQNLAELFRQQQRHDEAIASYRAVLAAEPDFALAHAGLGTALLDLQRHDEAVASLERAVSLMPGSPMAHALLVLMGRTLQDVGRSDAAADAFERALNVQPRDTEALDRLAGLRFEQQRYEDALDLYRTLAALKPGNADTHSNVGAVLFRMGQGEAALRSFDKALALDPAHPLARANREQVQKSLQQVGR